MQTRIAVFLPAVATISILLANTSAVAQIDGVRANAADHIDLPHVPGEVVVRFTAPPNEQTLAAVETMLGGDVQWRALRHAPHAKGQPNTPHPLSYYRIATVAVEADVLALSEQVAGIANVDFATVNARPQPSGFPNDPMFDQQWAHEKINTLKAWQTSTGNTDIIVGVIDTGCLIAHEDLQAHIWVNDDPPNGVDDDGNGFVDDTNGWDFVQNDNDPQDVWGHGTQVSGIVGAGIDNGLGITGIANLTLMTSKWWHTSGSDTTVAESAFYAVDNGAHVITMSLSCGCLMPATEEAMDYASDNGVVLIGSSGNAATASPHYPASYPNVMSIAAIDINDQLADFSNFGPLLDVGAPSPGILSTGPGGPSDYDQSFGGTSAAAPHVAGLAGLILSVDPTLTPDEVRNLINDNAEDLGADGFDNTFGHGRIDVGATIAAMGPGCPDLDADGGVGTTDLLVLLGAWGPNPGHPADLDGDGAVGATDLIILLGAWGPC